MKPGVCFCITQSIHEKLEQLVSDYTHANVAGLKDRQREQVSVLDHC